MKIVTAMRRCVQSILALPLASFWRPRGASSASLTSASLHLGTTWPLKLCERPEDLAEVDAHLDRAASKSEALSNKASNSTCDRKKETKHQAKATEAKSTSSEPAFDRNADAVVAGTMADGGSVADADTVPATHIFPENNKERVVEQTAKEQKEQEEGQKEKEQA